MDTLDLPDQIEEPSSDSLIESTLVESEVPSSGAESLVTEILEPSDDTSLETPSSEDVPSKAASKIQKYMHDLEVGLRESRNSLDQMEKLLKKPVVYGGALEIALDEHVSCRIISDTRRLYQIK